MPAPPPKGFILSHVLAQIQVIAPKSGTPAEETLVGVVERLTYPVKIYKQYGDHSIPVVTTNPYQLSTDVYGIGFVTADVIARSLGITLISELCYRSGTLHILEEATEAVPCFPRLPVLIDRVVARLAIADY